MFLTLWYGGPRTTILKQENLAVHLKNETTAVEILNYKMIFIYKDEVYTKSLRLMQNICGWMP